MHRSDQLQPRPVPRRRPGGRPLGRLPLIAAVAALTAVLAACTAPGGVPADDPRNRPIDRFDTQELAWEGCEDYATTAQDDEVFAAVPTAECARLEVPMDYADREGATASVAVVRIPARGESLGPLLFNPGGPGGSGLIGTVAASALMSESAITERFDLVGFDPRGVGATEPAVDCRLTDDSPEAAALLQQLGSVTPSLTEADTTALAERCADGSGGMDALAHVGTRTTANDMDVLREALGEDELNFLGQSYGTRLGAVYAEQFPNRVRAMVLDGAFDPDLSSQDRLLASYVGFQSAFDAMAAACAAEADCPLGTDPAGWTPTLQSIIQPLGANPVPAADTELDFNLAISGVMAGLYLPELWPLIADGLREVQQGRGDQLLALANGLGGVSADGESSNQVDASLAINCVDEDLLTPDELVELRTDTFAQVPIMDPGAPADGPLRDKCADFPAHGELGIPYAQDIEGLPGTLVISITGDPTTPHANGIALAETLGSTLLTVEGGGHTVVARGASACVDEIAATYLIDLELPDEAPTCTL
ncbi:alpha/beta fold hydrolase [Agromyces silvae]|uniref:alpha/beta fold hydrolase n=1 Tax=Agromyces silvae TaxID=3388266 RepID=UPI00280BA2B9|nr:alpha/beta fold hydrolase [Agromyces protaetiae]